MDRIIDGNPQGNTGNHDSRRIQLHPAHTHKPKRYRNGQEVRYNANKPYFNGFQGNGR